MKIRYNGPITEKNAEVLSKRLAQAQHNLKMFNLIDMIFSPIWMILFLLCAAITTMYGFNTYVGGDFVKSIVNIPFFHKLIVIANSSIVAKLPGENAVKWAIASVFLPGLIILPFTLLLRLLMAPSVKAPINSTTDRAMQAKILYDQAYEIGFTKVRGSKGFWLRLSVFLIVGLVGYFFVVTSGLLTTETLEMGTQETKSLTVCLVAILFLIVLAILSKTFQSIICGGKTRYNTNRLRKDILNYRVGQDIKHIISSALKNHTMTVKYQPVYNIPSKKFLSAEALVRLTDPTYGDISPSVFIPAAEKRGIIKYVTNEVLNIVCKFVSGLDYYNTHLSHINVNLSVNELMEINRVEELLEIVDSYKINHSNITFEITETAMSISEKIFWSNIQKLHDSGFLIALDDFGSGYSTFSRVVSEFISIIKVDSSMVADSDSSKNGVLLTDITRTLKHQNKELLIEGIETKAQMQFVTKLGYDYIQGFYYSKPLPEDEFVKFIKDKNSGVR